jgi:hypothetical protein
VEPVIVLRYARYLLTGWLLMSPPLFAEGPTKLNQWTAGPLSPDEGALFLYFEPSAKTSAAEVIQSEVTVSVLNLITKKTYAFSQSIGRGASPTIWRLPSGKYVVRSLKAMGSDGKVYNARFQKKVGKRFLIKKQHISHLSTWIVFTVAGDALKIGIKKQKNSYQPTDAEVLKNFKGIINGLNGKMELPFDPPESEDDESTKKPAADPLISSTRTIGMFFRLNMFKNNSHAPQIAAMIASIDQKIRKCYADALDRNPESRGEVVYRFAISKETKNFKKLSVSKSAISDEEMQNCIATHLTELQLPALKSMIGELIFNFEYSE